MTKGCPPSSRCVTPGGLASWGRWITRRFADLAALLGRAPGWAQAGMLVAIAVAVALPLWRAVRRGTAELAATDESRSRDSAVDPVCGMSVAVEAAAATVPIGGDTFYFCSRACAKSFERERDLTSVASE